MEAKIKRRSYRSLERAQDRLEQYEKEYLRQHGWHYTCQTPGSFWMWQKQLADGRILLVDQSHAISFQRSGGLE